MLLNIMFALFVASTVLYGIGVLTGILGKGGAMKVLSGAGLCLIVAGMALGIGMMTFAWVETGQPPFQTLFQCLIFFSVTTALVFLFSARSLPLLGLATAMFIVAILAYSFVRRDSALVQLPPALQSAWFIPHVVVYFLGYSALFVSFATSILYLIFPEPKKLGFANTLGLDRLDFGTFTYKSILFGYAMISAGLILGALWAKFAWGDWWTWDPKENWALITWLVYGAYLHLRYVGVSRKALAWISIAGFLAVMFTYLGVNYLPAAQEALHSYTL